MARRSRARSTASASAASDDEAFEGPGEPNRLVAVRQKMALFKSALDEAFDEPLGLAPPVVPAGGSIGDRPIHPSHGPADQVPRRDDGSVSTIYGIDKADLEEWGHDDYVPPRRERADGWSPSTQAEFIRALGDCGSVTRACQAVRRSRVSAYKLRRDPSARIFARAWDEAMASTATLLAETALDRAVNGQEEKVFYKGKFVGHRVRYDNRLLFAMLRARDPVNYAPIDQLERWEARRAPGEPLDAVTEQLEESEKAWQQAPRDELEAAGLLPLDTADAVLTRAAQASPPCEPIDEERELALAAEQLLRARLEMEEREAAKVSGDWTATQPDLSAKV